MINKDLIFSGMILGLITGSVLILKSTVNQILNKVRQRIIYSTTIYDYDELFYVFENWVTRHHQSKCRKTEASYRLAKSYVPGYTQESEYDNSKIVHYKQEQNILFVKYKGRWIIISKNKKELTNATEIKNLLNFSYAISGINAKDAIQGLLKEMTEVYNQSLSGNSINVYICDNGGCWNLVGKKFVKPLDRVILYKELKDKIINDIDRFVESKEWYQKLNLSYKRAYLFYGPPGTGKSTIAQSIAAYLKKSICMLNLNTFSSDAYLITAFSRIPENSILLIEDIDCIFNQRESSADTKVTFSTFINCLDGVISKDNSITIITTNHIEKLDPALLRAGRCDFKEEIKKAGSKEVKEYIELFFGIEAPDLRLIQDISMSSVQEICIRNKHDMDKAIAEIHTATNS